MLIQTNNDFFALRDETIAIFEDELSAQNQGEHPVVLAVMLRSVNFPDGQHEPLRADGAAVERAAVLSCVHNLAGKWRWVPLTAATKETIGDLLLDSCHAQRDRWYFAALNPLPKAETKPQP